MDILKPVNKPVWVVGATEARLAILTSVLIKPVETIYRVSIFHTGHYELKPGQRKIVDAHPGFEQHPLVQEYRNLKPRTTSLKSYR
jgi:hypothetical protein